jgi:hypothetical protein
MNIYGVSTALVHMPRTITFLALALVAAQDVAERLALVVPGRDLLCPQVPPEDVVASAESGSDSARAPPPAVRASGGGDGGADVVPNGCPCKPVRNATRFRCASICWCPERKDLEPGALQAYRMSWTRHNGGVCM